jgi:aldose 1-epimerase
LVVTEATSDFVLHNAALRVRINRFGGRLTAIEAADRHGQTDHVLLGFDDASVYQTVPSFGALLGRYANRIAGARFDLDGRQFVLLQNDGASTLHGGPGGFHHLTWDVVSHSPTELVLQHISPDGDQGFPGEVSARARYRLDRSTLWLTLTATTTQPTVLNLSTHPYFNLAGPHADDVADQELSVFADAFLPTDSQQIPTGEIRNVAGSAFDFRKPTLLRERLPGAIDHCFVLGAPSAQPRLAARLAHPPTGRMLELHTTQPGLQIYAANKFNGSLPGRGGAYQRWAGLALEPQHFPDAPNRPNFPATALRPGETFRSINGFVFGC